MRESERPIRMQNQAADLVVLVVWWEEKKDRTQRKGGWSASWRDTDRLFFLSRSKPPMRQDLGVRGPQPRDRGCRPLLRHNQRLGPSSPRLGRPPIKLCPCCALTPIPGRDCHMSDIKSRFGLQDRHVMQLQQTLLGAVRRYDDRGDDTIHPASLQRAIESLGLKFGDDMVDR